MELQRPRPPSYVSHNPSDLTLPSVPKTDVNHAHATAEITPPTLPHLRTVLSPDFQQSSLPSDHLSTISSHGSPRSVTSLPRIEPGPQSRNGEYRYTETAMTSPLEMASAMSIDERATGSPSISIDDPNVRDAAEALSGLSNPSFVRSPTSTRASASSPGTVAVTRVAGPDGPEPLFQMFAKAHPYISGTINGSLSAYSTTKQYSPRFVQYGAKLIEDKIAIPVVSTVGTMGRVTGVESGFRWYYGGQTRQPSDLERGSERAGVVDTDSMDVETEESALEELPAYRASKPPSYREEVSPAALQRRPDSAQSWSSQVFVMTSALGVALSDASRNTLTACLHFLAAQAGRIRTIMEALKTVLEQYDQARDAWHSKQDQSMEKGEREQTPEHDDAARRLAAVIKQYSDEIWKTLQKVVTNVSNYAGGALPENARHFVKTQLMSLPQRWRVVSDHQTGESETSRGAHRMIAFATEGLDMISQVSQTMHLTLQSAEQWLDRVGKRRNPHAEALALKRENSDHDMMDAPRSRDLEKQ